MGTRNLTKVIDRKGKVVVAQYGQWDGYPAGQGVNALYHLHNVRGIEYNLDKCHFLNESEIENVNSILSATDKPIFDVYPTLSRDVGADVLGYIAYATQQIPLTDNSDFENDTTFCEAVYTIDFQNEWFIAEWNYERFCWSFDKLPTKEEFLLVWKVR
jgi:hypothetical protein